MSKASRAKATTRRSSRQHAEDADSRVALMSRDINTGSEKLRPEDMLFRDRPGTPQSAFEKARSWQKENWFINLVNRGNVDFFNFGLRILPEDNTPANRTTLADWFRKNPKAKREMQRYVKTVWREWVLNQNVVSFWREEKLKNVPFLLLGEECDYTDAMGIEILQWKPTYKVNQMPREDGGFQFSNVVETTTAPSGFNKDWKNRYTSGRKIMLDPDKYDEHFEVLTTGYQGQGFSISFGFPADRDWGMPSRVLFL